MDEHAFTITDLRRELGFSQQQFAEALGLSSKGNVSILERGGPCSLAVALRLEELSDGRIDAAALNGDVAAARRAMLGDEPPSRATALPTDRVIICAVCDERVDDAVRISCTFVDCPHSAFAALAERDAA